MSGEEQETKPRSFFRSCLLYGCLPLLLLFASIVALAWSQAQANLRERGQRLRADIVAFEEELSQPRPVYFGEPQPGNAADEYWLINYVLGPPSTWDDKIPVTLAPTKYSYMYGATKGIESTFSSIELAKRAKANDRSPLPTDAARYLKAYGPLADHIRAGLRKERCDWRPPFEKGTASDIVNLIEVRGLAHMMVYQAAMADGEEAVEKALEVVVFGDDLARHPSLIQAMIGVAVQSIAVEALRPILERDLPAAAYRRVIELLGRLEPIDVKRGLVADHLMLSATLAALSGDEGFEPPKEPERMFGLSQKDRFYGELMMNGVFLEREWSAYLEWYERSLALADLPFTERVAASKTLTVELEGGWDKVARVAIPNVHEAFKHAEEIEARLQALRMLAAARLHRLKTGALPKTGAELTPYLGGALPKDPFKDRKKPLAYALNASEARVTWGEGSLAIAVNPRAGARPAGAGR